MSASLSTIVASPSRVAADVRATSTLTVTLKDTGGAPVAGKTVTLSAGGGSSTIVSVSGTTKRVRRRHVHGKPTPIPEQGRLLGLADSVTRRHRRGLDRGRDVHSGGDDDDHHHHDDDNHHDTIGERLAAARLRARHRDARAHRGVHVRAFEPGRGGGGRFRHLVERHGK